MLNEKQIETMTQLAIDVNALTNQLHVIAVCPDDERFRHLYDAVIIMKKCLGSLVEVGSLEQQKSGSINQPKGE